ncbi:hypothetical protein [Bacillus thuringiensis]|uniref:hypothetical protein n=1 Tax=Bacillus thuringiensis TaxID=1428 RepID=UPI000BFD2E78|nr:hypothetical protein [Bacillus thuringiensis]PGV73200.1 hypothetical protein COD83_25020 [Bacillus thuringiensis]
MLKQTLLWTALPNGMVAGNPPSLRLSAMVSPRLMADASEPTLRSDGTLTLQQFGDFLNWPKIHPEFSVRFANGTTLPAKVVSAPPRSDLWTALFTPETCVQPYVFNPNQLEKRQVRSFPVARLFWLLKNIYRNQAFTNPTEFPRYIGESGVSLRGLKELIVPNERVIEKIKGDLKQFQAIQPKPLHQDPDFPQGDFYQLQQFYPHRESQNRVEPQVPPLDFHQVISSLGDYPVLLRHLGLVYDLEVFLYNDIHIPFNGSMVIVPSWSSGMGGNIDRCPETRYFFDPANHKFLADSDSPRTKEGLLELHDPSIDPIRDVEPYSVIQVDVDSAALKFLDFIRNIEDKSIETPLPSLRSGGLSLVYDGRAWDLVHALGTSVQLNNDVEGGGGLLSSEHLVRGYRIDVWDSETKSWHSLCRRNGRYHFLRGGHIINESDEGFISMGITSAADNSSPDLYLHQSLFTWGGWSLVAPRPGRIIDPQDSVAHASNPAVTDFKLETNFKPVAKSLPRLRFGHTYRLRVRTVDLAGNSRELGEELPESASTLPVVYSRFEPVECPVVVLRKPTVPGESVYRMVLRSNYDSLPDEPNERHIAPPRTSQLMAELHGCFDTLSGLDRDAYGLMVKRDGTFEAEGIHSEAQLVLPYLPDPIARGAALFGLPGMGNGETKQVPFNSTGVWWEALPFRLRLVEGTGEPHYDKHHRVLTVQLVKAECATIQLSSYLTHEDWELMGIPRLLDGWASEGAPVGGASPPSPDELAQLRSVAVEGRHWMLTPFRKLTLVHAVRQPLIAPAFQLLEKKSRRNLDETFVCLKDDSILVSGKSTVKLDILATWQEPVDSLSEPHWQMAKHKAHVCEVKVDTTETKADLEYKHEFGDTKYRRVTYSICATSRFSEYFQIRTHETVKLTRNTCAQLTHHGIIEHTEIVRKAGNVIRYEQNKDYTIDYAKGTINRTAFGAIGNGETVEVEYAYLPEPITRPSEKGVTLDICNSARPAAPKVLYAVPAFGWEKQSDNDEIKIRRKGGGLRVYLDRPWYSSGDGELLGVVLWPESVGTMPTGFALPPEKVAPYVTQWGLDPIRSGAVLPSMPMSRLFTRAVATKPNLSLDEVKDGDVSVDVAGHKVEYDSVRKLWFCDLEIDAGDAYYPFVRLALARFQPMSVQGAHLSRVVPVDFVQLAPDRLVTIQTDPADSRQITVSLSGPGYLETPGGLIGGEAEVLIETRDPDATDEQGWLPVPNAIFALAPVQPPTTWTGQISLPDPRRAKPYRLVIREYERFEVDGVSQNNSDRRLVFAAALEI